MSKKLKIIVILCLTACLCGCQAKPVSKIEISEKSIIVNEKKISFEDFMDKKFSDNVTIIDNNAIKGTYDQVCDFLKSKDIEIKEEE